MIRLDNNLLDELGLGALSEEDKKRMLRQIYETLEGRVGVNLANKMTDEQLTEFEKFIDSQDEEGAKKWLETNFPNYKDVVVEEMNKLKEEIKASAPQILTESQTS